MSRHSVLENKYHFEYDIGQWTFGTVQAVREKESGTKRICKTVPKVGHLDLRQIREDLQRLQRLSRHPHVCSLLEVLEDEMCLHLIMEDCEGEDVSELLSRLDGNNWLDEQTVAVYILHALIATAHCHGAGITHGDLRTSSLGLTSRLPDANCKVIDFGFNSIFDLQRSYLRQNPSPFVAPEVLSGQVGLGPYPAGDVWSIGAVAYNLLVNRPPGSTPAGRMLPTWGLATSERPEFLPSDGWGERGPESRDFVENLLCPAANRLTAAQALQHPWIRRVAPQGSQKWMRTPGGPEEALLQYQRRVASFSLSVLLVPILTSPQDFERDKALFIQMDNNRDGFVPRALVGSTLRNRGVKDEAVAEALEIADAPRTGELDLTAFVVAGLLTSQLAKGSGSAFQRLEKQFSEVFCDARQPGMLLGQTVWSRLRTNNTAQQLERDTQVKFNEILAHLPDTQQPVEVSHFLRGLQQACGRGTPLEIPLEEHWDRDEGADDDGAAMVASLAQGLFSFDLNFIHMFSRCTTLKRNPSPHAVRIG